MSKLANEDDLSVFFRGPSSRPRTMRWKFQKTERYLFELFSKNIVGKLLYIVSKNQLISSNALP